MKKRGKKSKAIKDLFLDRPTSHGGWPDGHSGSYQDPNTPVYKQIANYLKSMGLINDDNPQARLAEVTRMRLTEHKIRKMIREALSNLPPDVSQYDSYFYGEDPPSANADVEDIIAALEETLEEYAVELGYSTEDDDEALRRTYEEDPDFYNDLYDEMMQRQRVER